jgi:hypothetical protein
MADAQLVIAVEQGECHWRIVIRPAPARQPQERRAVGGGGRSLEAERAGCQAILRVC